MSIQIHGVVCAAVTAIALLCAPAVSAQDAGEGYEAGVAAFEAENYERAKEILLPLAEAGDAQAQYVLAKLYENGGEGVMRSLTKAADWYRLAAESGLADAQNNLALLYIQGHGAPRSEERAFELWLDAARNGHRQAQYNVALAYYQGTGTEQNQAEAAEWFRKGAASGLAESQFALAEMYRLGVGVEEDSGRALYWYERALEQGHERAEAEAEKLRTAGIASNAPEELPQSAEPSPDESAEVSESESEEPVEETDASSAASEETETVEDEAGEEAGAETVEEARENEDRAAESKAGEADDTMDTVGGDQVPTPGGETSARNLFPLDSALQDDPEQSRDVKKNDNSGVKREKESTGAVELYPERMNRLARSRAETTAEEIEVEDAEEDRVASEEAGGAGSISGDTLSEMQADPLYEGAGEAAAEDEREKTDAEDREKDTGELQDNSQDMVSAETDSDTPDNSQQTDQTASRDGNFALWLGSMRTPDGARRLWNEALAQHGARLDGLSYDTREIETDDGVFLRVLAVGYETRAAGQESCEAIKASDSEAFCRVVTRQ